MIAAPYVNNGNDLVLSMVPPDARKILDVGCGAGGNARRLCHERTGLSIVGLTHNATEAAVSAPFMVAVSVIDIEHDPIGGIGDNFDLVIFSHVLEHMRDPVKVVKKCMSVLKPGGHVLIAVPNVLEWRTRFAFIRGKFNYADTGVLDRTHLRFFTAETAAVELVSPVEDLILIDQQARGAFPLGPFRRYVLTDGIRKWIDKKALKTRPNLFAGEVAMLAMKSADQA